MLSLLFNMLSRVVKDFLPRSSHFMASVTMHSDFGAQENKICHCFHISPSICHEVMGQDAIIFVFFFFLILHYKSAFLLSSLTLIKRFFSSSSFSAIKVVSSVYLRLWYFSQQSWFQLVIHPTPHFTWCTLHIS